MRASRPGAPLFCIHPSGGDIGIYRKLVRHLTLDYPVLGIQSRLLVGADDEFPTIDAMAEHYTTLVLEHQPEGAVRLLGFSFGGFVATAISSLLIKAGREVSFLGLVDSDLSWLESDESNRTELRVRLIQLSNRFQEIGVFNRVPNSDLKTDVDEIVERSLGSSDFSADDMLEFLRSRGYTSSQSPHAESICLFTSRFLKHCNMVRSFQVSRIDSPMWLWWPSEPSPVGTGRYDVWRSHATKRIVEYSLDGSHFSLMRMPTVRTLGRQVNKEMDAASRS